MLRERWTRYLPDASQAMLLAGVVIVLAAAVAFANLAAMKRGVEAREAVLLEKVRTARDQQDRLLEKLPQAERGETIQQGALGLGMVPPGTQVIVDESAQAGAAAGGVGAHTTSPPFWDDWWKHLVQP